MHVNRIPLPCAVNQILNRIARILISCHTRRRAWSVIADPAEVVTAAGMTSPGKIRHSLTS
ncbi:MAG: hypothetical protein HF976_00015 [ANME-2 cluster archaeon]|nr:hypothetical protein [ANME-2 cluster archaeon]